MNPDCSLDWRERGKGNGGRGREMRGREEVKNFNNNNNNTNQKKKKRQVSCDVGSRAGEVELANPFRAKIILNYQQWI